MNILVFVLLILSVQAQSNFIDYDSCDFASTTTQRVQWLEEIMIDTQNILIKYGVITWAVQSTLLGIVRDKKTMPWTWDVDMQTFATNISTICQNTSKAHQELKSRGYRIYNCMDNFARVCKANRTLGAPKYIVTGEPIESRLDIYGATLREDGLYDVIFSNCHWNLTANLFPLRNYSWENKTILGPNNYNYWLQFGYGFNWTVPDKYGGGRADLCVYNISYNEKLV